MPDIDIVPKHRSGNLWLWIVLAIVIIAIAWFALGRRGSNAHVSWNQRAAPVAAAQPSLVTQT